MTKLLTMGTWDEPTLHDVTTIGSVEEYWSTVSHILREDDIFEGINTNVFVRIAPLKHHGMLFEPERVYHVVFDTAYKIRKSMQSKTIKDVEHNYRESALALIIDRVVASHIHFEDIALGVVVSGENRDINGLVYDMEPALHLIINGDVGRDVIYAMIKDMYGYMDEHGYHIDNISEMDF